MSPSELNGNENQNISVELEEAPSLPEAPVSGHPMDTPEPDPQSNTSAKPANGFATRAGLIGKGGPEKGKLLLLGGGLLLAVLFFVFTAIIGKSRTSNAPSSTRSQQTQQQKSRSINGSITPLMEPVRGQDADNTNGEVNPSDIERTRTVQPVNSRQDRAGDRKALNTGRSSASLGNVPTFDQTQQKWEEPKPYDPAGAASTGQQQQNELKEASLVFVRNQTRPSDSETHTGPEIGAPFLEVEPGTRVLATLQSEISSADPTPVVAQIEYTYAIGEQVIIPAGARIFGQIQQADISGNVTVKFTEVELQDHQREQIAAVGKGLDMGPIRGIVTGKNTGKNLFVRSVSGVGSTLATVFGTNTGSAFSEDDMIRERLAENIGTAGDSEIMNMALNTHPFVSVPAGREIYVVFTKHETTPATLHKVP